jgi:F-type H+-transporting ATPase subunit alpha
VLKAVNAGLLDSLDIDQMGAAEDRIQQRVLDKLPQLCARMESSQDLQDQEWRRVLGMAGDVVSEIEHGAGS